MTTEEEQECSACSKKTNILFCIDCFDIAIQEGRAEERERTLKVIDKFKKEACSCSKMDGICKSCDEWDRLITKIQEKKE